jgi:signal transduction histidine kinase
MTEIIEDVIQRCRPQTEEGQVEISTTYAPDLPSIQVDRQRLEQVFTNLIINATQAMQSSGQEPEERKLFIQTKIATSDQKGESLKEVFITFADTGPGIPAESRQLIFEPFYTTKARGTGLGLTVARRVIEEHQGTISIESNKERGTCFIITLPIQRETES